MVASKPYPKSDHGRRTVPLPAFAIGALRKHTESYPPSLSGEIFTNEAGGPLRRSTFQRRVWRPSLVRAGLLGNVVEEGPKQYRATWLNETGCEQSAVFRTEPEAIDESARRSAGGLRFHDLRHSYATWLVSAGVPINDTQRLMGHSRPSTTLDLYTHAQRSLDSKVGELFADFPLTLGRDEPHCDESKEPGSVA
jgi:integrase